MGYDVHISRRADWIDSGDDISLDEWLTYVAHDADLESRPAAIATTPEGVTISLEQPGLAVWIRGDCEVWFMHSSGVITVKNPDDQILAKMIEVAEALGARVQGDDGEFYDSPSIEPKHKPWWRIW